MADMAKDSQTQAAVINLIEEWIAEGDSISHADWGIFPGYASDAKASR